MVSSFYITLSVMIGSTLIVSMKTEHHEIPIISNYTSINNTFTITDFLNFTSLLTEGITDQEEAESYDDGVALMNDYIDEEEDVADDDGHQVTDTSRDMAEDDDDDEDSDFKFLATRARWSYAPGFVERWCRAECQDHGKPFGRLLGTRCQCYCPLNAPTLGLCDITGKCDRYCSSVGYPKGGSCVYNNVCFCYCRKAEPYDVTQVHAE